MNRDTLIGFLLIGLVLIGFSWYNQPSKEEAEAYQRQQDSIAAALAEKDKAVKQQLADAEKASAQQDKELLMTKEIYCIVNISRY
jgi:YidC/Oxa1 family membrane protein insertase